MGIELYDSFVLITKKEFNDITIEGLIEKLIENNMPFYQKKYKKLTKAVHLNDIVEYNLIDKNNNLDISIYKEHEDGSLDVALIYKCKSSDGWIAKDNIQKCKSIIKDYYKSN